MPPARPFEVELPAGGMLTLDDAEEVDLWNTGAKKYVEDYGIVKQNDLVLLGAMLTQNVIMYRAQRDMMDAKKAPGAQDRIIKASSEIRDLEKALGIDKKTREAGGQHTIGNYLTTLKQSAREKGVRIADRVKAYEAFVMELRWKLRVLENGDAEDRQHHGISKDSVLEWASAELQKLEEADKTWAHQKGKVFVGKL